MNEIYNKEYYDQYILGNKRVAYNSCNDLIVFMKHVAMCIVNDFHPRTVLDAGCATGHLVAALRDLGVEAYGIDISEYAISQIRDDIKPYCHVHSLANSNWPDALPTNYDLIVSIEVLEHLYAEDGKKAISSLCNKTDAILFSSTPNDFEDRTHVNVQQREYWAGIFADNGFYDKVFYDASYVSPQALLFSKTEDSLSVIKEYERFLRISFAQPKGVFSSRVYFDCGNGESENNCIVFEIPVGEIFKQKVALPRDCRTVRFDPFEGMGGMIYNLHIRTINSLLQVSSHNGIKLGNLYLFQTHDPQLRIDLSDPNLTWIEISAELLPVQETGWLELFNSISSIRDEYEEKLKVSKNSRAELQNELAQNQIEITKLNSCIENMQNEMADMLDLSQKLQNEVEDYSNLVAYERGERQKISDALLSIQNSTIWKVSKPLRMLMDAIKRILALTRKILSSMRKNGIKETCIKVKNKLRGQTTIPALASHHKIDATKISITGHPIDPIQIIAVSDPVKRINLVTDTIDSKSLLGGVATALIVATEFASRYNYELRIITRNSEVNPLNYVNILRVCGVTGANKVTFYSDAERHEREIDFKLEVGPNDVFFATSWWSAKAINETIMNKRFFYIIQEVETFFYNFGSEHLLCSQMMNQNNIDYIINSKYLYDYFIATNKNIVENGCYFEPAFPDNLYSCKGFEKKNHYKLFFYARPNNPRNLYTFGVEMLDKAVSTGILDTNHWDIYCVGQNTPEITFCNGYKSKNLGQLSWTEYAEFLADVDLGLCLMYTPHPSYPPYDVACSGGVVLSNKMLNKVEFKECKNVILSSLEEKEFLHSFEKAVALAQDMQTRKKNYVENSIHHNWNETLKDTISYMGTCLDIV